MPTRPLPPDAQLKILFSHGAYHLADRFAARRLGIAHVETRSVDSFRKAVADADIVCLSMHWQNDVLPIAKRLRFIQSVSAGTDQYDKAALKASGVRLASAAGVNANAVAEHAIAMLLALTRQLHTGRDNQGRSVWRGMHSTISARESEIAGKTIVIVGTGRIGGRLAELCRAFGMHVIGVRRSAGGPAMTHETVPPQRLHDVLARADVIALCCPLTTETERLIDQTALAATKPGAYLINVARGKVVDEPALIRALQTGHIAGAGLDVTVEEPLPPKSPLWNMPNVVITPHTAGETQAYEDRVIDLLIENMRRLQQGERHLVNEIV